VLIQCASVTTRSNVHEIALVAAATSDRRDREMKMDEAAKMLLDALVIGEEDGVSRDSSVDAAVVTTVHTSGASNGSAPQGDSVSSAHVFTHHSTEIDDPSNAAGGVASAHVASGGATSAAGSNGDLSGDGPAIGGTSGGSADGAATATSAATQVDNVEGDPKVSQVRKELDILKSDLDTLQRKRKMAMDNDDDDGISTTTEEIIEAKV
jgi:hypothetical protein